MRKPLAGIFDISTNNILSINRGLEYIGFDTKIINQKQSLEKLDLLVLPGVGSFNVAMKKLKENHFLTIIEKYLEKNKNFLGICLGMQLLFEESEEFENTKGIGFFKGKVKNFELIKSKKQTFIGWNYVKTTNKQKSFDNNIFSEPYYFVHSCYVNCVEKDIEIGKSYNGETSFSSIVNCGNVEAFQFHPEKSGKNGLNLLKTILQKI